MKCFNTIGFLTVLFITMLIMISCGGATETVKGSLKGYVILADAENNIVDHSSITVAVYKKVTLEPAIESINRDHPLIGVHISQETEFDHRFSNPLYTATTDVTGLFEIRNIPVGEYNIVFSKEGWGFVYRYGYIVYETANEISTAIDPIKLYPEIFVINPVVEDMVLESDRNYIFESNTDFFPNTHLTIKPGSIIRINPDMTVSVYGNLTVESEPGKYFRVTSNDGFDSPTNNIGNYANFYIRPTANITDQTISGGIFSYGHTTLFISKNDTIITNSIFAGESSGCVFDNINNIAVINSIFKNTRMDFQAALNANFVENGTIEKSIFWNNAVGIDLIYSTDILIKNSYFTNNSLYGVYNREDSRSTILHSVFANGDNGVANSHRGYVTIQYSIFQTTNGVNNLSTNHSAWPTLNYNNFNCAEYAVITNARYPEIYGIQYLDARYNYWGTTVVTEIEALIWDRNDISSDHIYYHRLLGVFVYQPYLNIPVSIAGIRVEEGRKN